MKLLDSPNTLSRRTWLRDTAIAATSAVVVPSMLISCSDHRIPPGVGLLDPPLTLSELAMAAANLESMWEWYFVLYTSETNTYIGRAYNLLKSGGEAPKSWSEIVVDIFTEIGLGVLEAALEEFPGVGPAIAATVKEVEKWAMKEKEGRGIDAAFAQFRQGHDHMYNTVSTNLLLMAEPGPKKDYPTLQEAFKGGEIEFNGKKYNLRDLANADFPFVDHNRPAESRPAEFNALINAASLKFKRYFWNAMFMKAGTMTYVTAREVSYRPEIPGLPANNPTRYAQEEIYNDPINAEAYNAVYLRAYYNTVSQTFFFRQYYWTFDGLLLSEGAVNELFQDDTPEHIINPNGLFLRSYVFKQFHTKKPDFDGWHNLRKDLDWGPLNQNDDCFALDCPDNYEFTGGLFPSLIQK